MVKIYQIISILLLITLSFIPKQIDMRINYAIIGFAILTFPLFFKNVKEDIKSGNITTIFFILFLIACSLSTIFSIDQKRSIVQLMLFASYFVVFTSIRSIFPTLRSKEVLGSWFLVLSLILSTISLYHTLILKYVNRASEGVSFMWIYYGHNHLSALLLFAIPIAFYLIKKYWKTKRLNALLFITCYVLLVTLFFTLARAAMLSLFVASLLSFLVFPNIIARQGRVILLIGIIFTLAVLLFGILASNRSFPTYRGAMPLNENNSRIVYWKQAISNFQKHPLFGSGLDTFRIINKRSPQPKGIPGSYFVHNFFLQILSDTGIFGFLSSIGLIGSVLWKSVRRVFEIRNSQKALLLAFWVGLLATTLNTMIDFDWQLPVVFLIFWIFAGFLTSKHV